jgi:hypothetical protein
MEKKLICPECNHIIKIEGKPGESKIVTCENCNFSNNYTFSEEDNLISNDEKDILKYDPAPLKRPLGITILAILQIIGTILLITLLIIIPFILGGRINEINDYFGYPIVEFLYLLLFTMIPISILLSYGLWKGKEWARFSTVLFQIGSGISSVVNLNIFGIIIPIIIILYLYQPHIKKYFHTFKGIKKNIKTIIIVGISILTILNCYVALYSNPFLAGNNRAIPAIPDSRYYGTWENSANNIELTFYENSSFIYQNDSITLKATWENTQDMFNSLLIDWGDQQIKYVPAFSDANTVEFWLHMDYWDDTSYNYSFILDKEFNKKI